ncbi:hypothetical protein C6361_34195 [Plantactinospora sp. BC1]|uniref:low temperature requirement protein A n=1 Tax=Plantactinospora sp. BC1 TaxID=2108470 RepID=UPI000D1533E6|nr:low temperature requirement protein A [Plantactinospora sp. BC1]AVT33663.1 hypothetical protein C6361_34195 [Plantactinospora sp. BC1]
MLLPRPKDARRPTMLELFFDLVYVVVLALISQRLESGPGWLDALHALILLMALWWVWAVTVLVSNLYDPQHSLIQLTTLCALVGSLLMTAAIPTAFGPHGVVFASAYVGIHLTRGFLLAPALRGQPEARARAISVLSWFTASGVLWMAGGVSDGTRRVVLWAVALGIDSLGFGLRFPVPRLRRFASSRFFVVSDHLAERLQQFFIISLGDAILIIGIAMSRSAFEAPHLTAFAVTLGSPYCCGGSTGTARARSCRWRSKPSAGPAGPHRARCTATW